MVVFQKNPCVSEIASALPRNDDYRVARLIELPNTLTNTPSSEKSKWKNRRLSQEYPTSRKPMVTKRRHTGRSYGNRAYRTLPSEKSLQNTDSIQEYSDDSLDTF